MNGQKGYTRADYYAAVQQHGGTEAAAKALGVNRRTVQKQVALYLRSEGLDGGIKSALSDTGLSTDTAKLGWRRVKHEDGSFNTVFWKLPDESDGGDVIERIREAVEGMAAAPLVPAPSLVNANLLTVYPLADAHVGMMAWGKETGEDYDTNIAAERIKEWVGRCVASSPASDHAVILDVGDLTHADDQTNQTPQSKHVLDVDTRHFRTLEVVIAALVQAVETALTKHREVTVRILPGNHNRTSYMAVMFALAERYRDNERVKVHKDPSEFFVLEWGRVMICAHHGDKAKAQRMVLAMADLHPEIWGRTRHRFLFTGHLHHHKSEDIGGVTWEQLRALTARDAYAASHSYTARAQLQAITYDRERGEVQRVKVGM